MDKDKIKMEDIFGQDFADSQEKKESDLERSIREVKELNDRIQKKSCNLNEDMI